MIGDKSQLSPANRATSSTTGVYSFYLAGQWLTTPQTVDVISPFDGRVIGRVSLAQPEHLERAIKAAEAAFAVTRKLPAFERQKALAKIASELSWTRRGIRAVHLGRGGQADPHRARRGGARGLYLQVCG